MTCIPVPTIDFTIIVLTHCNPPSMVDESHQPIYLSHTPPHPPPNLHPQYSDVMCIHRKTIFSNSIIRRNWIGHSWLSMEPTPHPVYEAGMQSCHHRWIKQFHSINIWIWLRFISSSSIIVSVASADGVWDARIGWVGLSQKPIPPQAGWVRARLR